MAPESLHCSFSFSCRHLAAAVLQPALPQVAQLRRHRGRHRSRDHPRLRRQRSGHPIFVMGDATSISYKWNLQLKSMAQCCRLSSRRCNSAGRASFKVLAQLYWLTWVRIMPRDVSSLTTRHKVAGKNPSSAICCPEIRALFGEKSVWGFQ